MNKAYTLVRVSVNLTSPSQIALNFELKKVQNDEQVHEVLKYAFHQDMQRNKMILIQGKQIY